MRRVHKRAAAGANKGVHQDPAAPGDAALGDPRPGATRRAALRRRQTPDRQGRNPRRPAGPAAASRRGGFYPHLDESARLCRRRRRDHGRGAPGDRRRGAKRHAGRTDVYDELAAWRIRCGPASFSTSETHHRAPGASPRWSANPRARFAACTRPTPSPLVGPRAQWLTEAHHLDSHSFGAVSPLGRLIEADGFVLGIGVDLGPVTFFHTVEDLGDFPFTVYTADSPLPAVCRDKDGRESMLK